MKVYLQKAILFCVKLKSTSFSSNYVSGVAKWDFTLSAYCPLDTGRKLNVHQAFRKRPVRLLYVLCTLQLSFLHHCFLTHFSPMPNFYTP